MPILRPARAVVLGGRHPTGNARAGYTLATTLLLRVSFAALFATSICPTLRLFIPHLDVIVYLRYSGPPLGTGDVVFVQDRMMFVLVF